jgi:hypothetical protein
MKAIKQAVKLQLSGAVGAKFSRMFYDGEVAGADGYRVCGRVTSKETGDAERTTRFFYGMVTLPADFDHPVIADVRIGRTDTDIATIWKTCLKQGLL